MTGIGEVAYTLLLGWMRALVDWLWSMFSGTGNTGAWNWFLSNWKIWLIVLLVGGLVVDWLMWVVRWRPYRLVTSRIGGKEEGGAEEDWDDGVGFYAPETAQDEDVTDWSDATFGTLSEIDPNWAGNVTIGEDEEALYDPDYTGQAGGTAEQDAYEDDAGYWAEDDDMAQAEDGPYTNLYAAPPRTQPAYEVTYRPPVPPEEPQPPEDDAPTRAYAAYHEDAPSQPEPEAFDPYAPYDAYDPQEAAAYEEADEPEPEEAPLLYGRPGMWPGMAFGFSGATEPDAAEEPEQYAEPVPDAVPEPEETPQAEAYDPLFSPEAPQAPRRRRRRRLRESTTDEWNPQDVADANLPPEPEDEPIPSWLDASQAAANAAYMGRYPGRRSTPEKPTISAYVNSYDAMADTRPSRIVRAANDQEEDGDAPAGGRQEKKKRKKNNDFKTVTGKPAKPKGIRRFTSLQEDPIAGLPPLDLTNPFLPPIRPEDVNVDFAPDEGEEYFD